jgi:hypothetical protein
MFPGVPAKIGITARYSGNIESDRIEIEVTPSPAEPPTKPGTPTASNITARSATLSWTKSTDNVGVTGYLVSLDGATPIRVIEPTHTFSELKKETSYSVEVKATDAAGNLSEPSSATFSTAVGTGSPPRNLRVTRNANKSVRLEWDAPIDIRDLIEYKFWAFGVPLSLGNNKFYEPSLLVVGKSYTFTLTAFYKGDIYSDRVNIDFTVNP